VEYSRRHGYRYESFIGIKRGIWPWQATYNRIVQLKELIDRGFLGWAIYLDADAYIVDLDFDLDNYLSDKNGYSAVLCPSMVTDNPWDINIGVGLFNLGHAVGRGIVEEWYARLMALPEGLIIESEVWLESGNDQDLIQQMLLTRPDLMATVYLQSVDLMNSDYASFIRQYLRGYNPNLEERIRAIGAEVGKVMGDAGDSDRGDDLILKSAPPGWLISEVVSALYWATLKRAPDPAGLAHSSAILRGRGIEQGLRDLIGEVLRSEEFRTVP
jgi:hypothetical protein